MHPPCPVVLLLSSDGVLVPLCFQETTGCIRRVQWCCCCPVMECWFLCVFRRQLDASAVSSGAVAVQ